VNHNFRLVIYIALLLLCLGLAGCAATESIPTDNPTVAKMPLPSPTVSVETATLAPTKETTPTASVDYQWSDESPAPESFTVIRIEPGPAKVKDILKAEAQKAAALGRDPYIEFYADWCPPCNAIKKNLSDPLMVDAFAGTYIIKLNTDDWGDKLSGLGIYVPGIPAFYELGANGTPTGRMITGAAWGEDTPANIAPPMKAFFEVK
jgi:thiol-disulfide isomerase/thioredoxin